MVDYIMTLASDDAKSKLTNDHEIALYVAKVLFKDVLNGLNYLHENGFIHRDVKLDNIMYSTGDNKCKLGDFTVSTKLTEEDDRMHNHEGTVAFTAPESHVPDKDGFLPMPTDMWSLGVCLYTVVTETLPFYSSSELEM